MWIIFGLLSAICATSSDVIAKKSTLHTSESAIAFSLQLFAALVLFIIVLVTGIPHLHPLFWVAVFGFSITVPLWTIFYMKALKLAPLSDSIPMLAFNPIFTALLSIFFDGKFPSLTGWIGIFGVCIGLYLSRLKKDALKKGILYPLAKIQEEPGVLAMLLVAFIWAIGAHLNKMATVNSSSIFASFSSCFVGAIVLFFFTKNKKEIRKEIRARIKVLGTLGVINGLSELFLFTGLSLGYTPYVVPVKRASIIGSSVMGKILFKEEFGMLKVLGIIIMFAGLFVIILS
jgi:drug/metabolite transporter (DMT)-like permease